MRKYQRKPCKTQGTCEKAKTEKSGIHRVDGKNSRIMKNGISESQAYERFGKRCQLPEYIRLGSVLSQNLKKGSKGLTELLESEAASSMNERKNHAKKIGEQAGTKLLLPMVMMLGIVLVILMVPAFLSF